MAPSDTADPKSELPCRLQQSSKNTPVLVLLFRPPQSYFVQCSLKRRLNFFSQYMRNMGTSRRLGEKLSS